MGGRLSVTTSLIVLALALLPQALGVGIGVNKGSVNYEDVLQNGYAQEIVLVTTDSQDPIGGSYEITGELAPWTRVEPANATFQFSASSPYEMTIIVEPPADAQLRVYSGAVRVQTGQLTRTEGGQIGTSTRAAFLIRINMGVSGVERIQCTAGGLLIRSSEIGEPFDFLVSVINRGNVRISPEFELEIFDQYQSKVVQTVTLQATEEILPTTTARILQRVNHDLPPGQYWARASVPLCGAGELLTFDVLERGGIQDNGELIRVETNPWASTGEIIPIRAIFKNLGGRTVSAKFTGTVTRQDSERIFKVIDTDEVDVRPGETVAIESFFNPTEPGRYIAAGRVLYNRKLTFQKSGIINVQGPFLQAAKDYTLLFILLIIVILILLLIIRKRRRRRHR